MTDHPNARPETTTTVSQKADYVRRAPLRKGHTCHWPGCTREVPPAMWGCKTHWFRLPQALRNRIWRAYRPGQEEDRNISEDYLKVAREAQEWIAANAR